MNEEAFFYKFGEVVKDIMKAPKALLRTNNIMRRHASPNWHTGLDHAELYGKGIVIEGWIIENTSNIEVSTDITARKKGDQALELLKKHLLQIKMVSGKTVIHRGVSTNDAAIALFNRHPEYEKVSEDEFVLRLD